MRSMGCEEYVIKPWYSETARITGDGHLFVGLDHSLWAHRAGLRNSL